MVMYPAKFALLTDWVTFPDEHLTSESIQNLSCIVPPIQHRVKPLELQPIERRRTAHARIESDVYCALETYRGVALRYVEDHKRGGVRVYIETPIDWGGRSNDPHTTHLWPANHDGVTHPPYICVKAEYQPQNLEAARLAAQAWVRGTQVYVATGKSISERIANGETL